MKTFKNKYFDTENKTITTEEILHVEEKITEIYKPNKRAYIFSQFANKLWFIGIWLALDILVITMLITSNILDAGWGLIVIIAVFFTTHLTPVWIWLANIIKAIIKVNYIEYILTNERVIIKESNKLLDVHSIYYTTITSVTTEQLPSDLRHNVGNIILITTHKSVRLQDLNNYNEIAMIIHQKSVAEYENERLNNAEQY